MRLPSASKLQLAMVCTASHVLPQVRREYAAGEAGRWKHAFVAALVSGADVEAALAQVPPEFHEACRAIDASVVRGLSGINELALAYDVETETTRYLGTDIARAYGELRDTEISMSLDYAGRREASVTVGDLKTGRGYVPGPARNWQLKVAALALARMLGLEEAEVWLALAPEGQQARFEVAHLEAFDLVDAAEELRALAKRLKGASYAVSKGAVPHLTVGEHCRFCPARVFCPAQKDLVQRLAGEPEKVVADLRIELTQVSAARAWHRLKAVKALLQEVESSIYAYASGTPIDLGDGRWLGPKETRRESLDGRVVHAALEKLHGREVADTGVELESSKAAVKRALRGVYEARKAAGEKVTLTELEAEVLGAVRQARGTFVKTTTTVAEYTAPSALEPGPLQVRPEPPPPSDGDAPAQRSASAYEALSEALAAPLAKELAHRDFDPGGDDIPV